MSDFIVPIAAVVIGAAVVIALRRQQGQDAQPFDAGQTLDAAWDFSVQDTSQEVQQENWSGNVWTEQDVYSVPVEGDEQMPGMIDSAVTSAMDIFTTSSSGGAAGEANVRAFLDMIAMAEGTDGPEGYRVMFGYPRFSDRLITSWADHPRKYFSFTAGGRTQKTSAAGRYQFLVGTWDELRKKLGLQDFSPASQDAACIELIRQRGALADVRAGRVASAITKCAKTWASLPGAGYGQPEQQLGKLLYAYRQAGGTTLEA